MLRIRMMHSLTAAAASHKMKARIFPLTIFFSELASNQKFMDEKVGLNQI